MIIDKGFFVLARNASKNSNYKIKIGCVIAIHGKPVSVGWNVVKTHPTYTGNSHRRSIHAEIRAVISARCDVTGGIAYVYRETRNGVPALCKPCDFCHDIMGEAGIRSVYYTTAKKPYYKFMRLK